MTGPINSTVTNNALNNVGSSSGGTNVLSSAYTGKGGSASGGDVTGDESGGLVDLFTGKHSKVKYWYHGTIRPDAFVISAGNAGKGGDAASGGAGSNLIPVPVAQAKGGIPPKAPISQPLPLLRIIRARMDMD